MCGKKSDCKQPDCGCAKRPSCSPEQVRKCHGDKKGGK
jgi:hypothetical protein